MDCVAPPSTDGSSPPLEKGGRRDPSVSSSRFLVAKGDFRLAVVRRTVHRGLTACAFRFNRRPCIQQSHHHGEMAPVRCVVQRCPLSPQKQAPCLYATRGVWWGANQKKPLNSNMITPPCRTGQLLDVWCCTAKKAPTWYEPVAKGTALTGRRIG